MTTRTQRSPAAAGLAGRFLPHKGKVPAHTMSLAGRVLRPERGDFHMEMIERRPSAAPTVGTAAPHQLQMTDRKRLSMTGVQEVSAYDAYTATLETGCGTLVVGGSNIKVRGFSAESGEVTIEGEIEYLQYQTRRAEKGGWLQRLLR